MLTLVVSGRGRYRNSTMDVEVTEGMVGLVYPGDDAGVLMAVPEDPYDHFYSRFEGDEAIRTARRITAEHDGAPFFYCPNWREFVEPFEKLCGLSRTIRSSPPERTLPVDAQVAFLLSVIDGGIVSARARITGSSLRAYMRDHIAERADLERMAVHFGVSKAHLCRAARSSLGDTVVRTWTAMKMEWATLFLGDSTLSVSDAARRAGYEDAFYFSRVFKTQFGVSPAAWRRARSDEKIDM
jgi:AraC-like DNA-binding protein